MSALARLKRLLKGLLKGRALTRAAERNAAAADQLDAALRELLKP